MKGTIFAICLLPALCYSFSQFRVPKFSNLRLSSRKTFDKKIDFDSICHDQSDSDLDFQEKISSLSKYSPLLTVFIPMQQAFAAGGEYGLLEGRIGNL